MKSYRILLVPLILMIFGMTLIYAEGPVTTKDLNIFSWRHIGPWNFSGRITDFAVPVGQSQIYYVATASGGVWKTEDGGISFEPIFDQYGNMSIGNIEAAPSDPNIVYMGTGEAMHARASAHGNGMWKSTDAGKTWAHIGLEKSYYIPRLAIDDKNPDIVYVACEGELYNNDYDKYQRGLYKTTDGGKTWAGSAFSTLKTGESEILSSILRIQISSLPPPTRLTGEAGHSSINNRAIISTNPLTAEKPGKN